MSGLRLVGTISGNCSFLPRSTSNSQSLTWFDIPDLFSLLFWHISPSFTNRILISLFLVCFASFLCISITSASSRSTWLCRHVYLPSVYPESTCCHIPLFPHNGQSGVSECFHLCRFLGNGDTSYTDLRRNCSWYWGYRHISDHVRDRCSTSHFDQAPWLPNSTIFACLFSSSLDFISLWTRLRLSLVFFKQQLFDVQMPCLPTATVLTISLCPDLLSASETALEADHFRPVLTWTSAVLTLSSLDYICIITRRVLLTLNSSIIDVNGSCNFADLLYSPTDIKLG